MKLDQKHTYDYKVLTDADTAPARVVRTIGRNRRVLEVGSGPGSITKVLTHASGCKVTALEIDPSAIELVRPHCEQVFRADLNSMDWPGLLNGQKFEVVLAADVLEHVYAPLAVLKKMADLVEDGGSVVLSLPHVGHSAIASCLMAENFDYRDWGLLDRTHIRFFGLKNMQSLVADAGLKIVHAEFVVRHPAETEFAVAWNALSKNVQDALLTNRHGLVYQVVLKAEKSDSKNHGVDLMSLPVEFAPESQYAGVGGSAIPEARSAVRRMAAVLPPSIKSVIRRVATRAGIRL
jgi:2-polyprenyl-3-methyl-5-hydroxy-6-metoxy-1,4-benzoquinol methylase